MPFFGGLFYPISSPFLALPLIGNQLIICLEGHRFPEHYYRSEITAAAQQRPGDLFIPFNAFIVAIGLYWAIGILPELLD